jgi:hypothetical protein
MLQLVSTCSYLRLALNLLYVLLACYLFVATAIAAVPRRVLTAFLLAALESSAAEVADGALSWELGWADLGSELKSFAVR